MRGAYVVTPAQVIVAGLHAWYTVASFNISSNVWRDVSGNSRNGTASGGGFSIGAVAGFGSTAGTVPFVQGATITSSVAFAAMPAVYSICTLSRYGGSATNKRIISGQLANLLHGHWNGAAGWAYYGNTFLTTACVQVCVPAGTHHVRVSAGCATDVRASCVVPLSLRAATAPTGWQCAHRQALRSVTTS